MARDFRRFAAYIPNALSCLRGLSAPLFLAVANAGKWHIAFVLVVYAVLSDLLDGPIARRLNQATLFGNQLDHTADFLFVFFGLSALAFHDASVVPYALPVVQLIAFLEYALVRSPRQVAFLPSLLGRYNGISYFVVVATATTQLAFQIEWVPDVIVYGLAWILVVTTITSIGLRAIARRRTSNNE